MRLYHPAFPQHVLLSCRTVQRFSLEQRLYTSEGINWSHITWQDTWSTDAVRHQFTHSSERNSLDTMFVNHSRPSQTCRHFSLASLCFKHLQIIRGCFQEPVWYQQELHTLQMNFAQNPIRLPAIDPVHCWDHLGEQKVLGFLWIRDELGNCWLGLGIADLTPIDSSTNCLCRSVGAAQISV